jgi:hypothetical protein
MNTIICNIKGSKHIHIEVDHLLTIKKYALFSELIDSSGLVDEDVLEKLRLNVRSLIESTNDIGLLKLCQDVLFHTHMKAFGLHQLILLYIDWEEQIIQDQTQQS